MEINRYPQEWKMVKLSDIGEVNRGKSRYRPRYAPHLYNGPYPFIQTGDIKASSGRIRTYHQTYSEAGLAQSRLWPEGTMCITIAANIAETGILMFPSCFPDSVVGFIADKSKCDVFFVEYMFRYLRQRIQQEAIGSVQDNINLATLDRLHFPLPPLSEQQAIAHVLGTLDDKIELNRQMNETMEAMAKAIFKSWFVDFDPVRAIIKGLKPYGMDQETAAFFPGAFEDSALGKIPKRWSIKNLREVIEINPQRSLSTGQSAPYLEMNNMPTSSARALDWEYRDFSSGMKFMNGDVLLARITPCLENGKTAYVDFLEDGQVGWGSTEYIVLCSKPPLPKEYAYFLARSDELRTHAIQNMTGTSGRQRVPAECFKAYPIVVPPEKIAVRFGEIVRPFMLTIKQYDEESHTLAAIRDALLPKLLSGEIKVRDAEKYTGAYL